MISAWPERSSRIRKTSRIFSRARSSAGEGGGGGASGVMTGAAAEIDGTSLELDGTSLKTGPAGSPTGSAPSRRMTIVGTPSSPVTRKRRPRGGESAVGVSFAETSDESIVARSSD